MYLFLLLILVYFHCKIDRKLHDFCLPFHKDQLYYAVYYYILILGITWRWWYWKLEPITCFDLCVSTGWVWSDIRLFSWGFIPERSELLWWGKAQRTIVNLHPTSCSRTGQKIGWMTCKACSWTCNLLGKRVEALM